MLFLHEVHEVTGKREGDFESAIRDGWMRTLAEGDEARLLYYANQAHGSGRSYQVSTAGGTHPRWAANGEEMYYISGRDLNAVDIETVDEVRLSAPRRIASGWFTGWYDVDGSGSLFMIEREQQGSIGRIHVVTNWFTDLVGSLSTTAE